ncbi:hypothetical protein ACQY0O_000650 [Thecaphora frezii]
MGFSSTVAKIRPTWTSSSSSSSSSPSATPTSSADASDHHHLHSSSSHHPKFHRARKYRPPPTSFHSSIQAIQEEFGSPRTSKEVKQAYLDSLTPSINADLTPPTTAPPSPLAQHPTIAAPPHASEGDSGAASPRRRSAAAKRVSSHRSPRATPLASPHDSPRPSTSRRRPSGRPDEDEDHRRRSLRHHDDVGDCRHSSHQPHRDHHHHHHHQHQCLEEEGRRRQSRRQSCTYDEDEDHHRQSRRSSRIEGHDSKRSSRRASRRASRAPDVETEAEPGSAAAQVATVRRGEKPVGPSKERMLIAQQRALCDGSKEKRDQPDIGPGSAPKPPAYPMTGMDNLALLMEDDGYTTSCFSIYMFKTELDIKTVDNFFEVLAKTYPKYRYIVDLDPKESECKEKEAAKATFSEKPQSEERKFDPGRRTRYGKGLKAGTLWRSAWWRFVPDFDVRDNILQTKLEAPGNEVALNRLAGEFLGRHYDYSKPIWEALVVNGIRAADGGRSALMIKIHHCFSDGQGMIQSYHAALGALEAGIGIRDIQRKVDSNQGVKKPGQREVKPTVWGTTKHIGHTIRGLYFRKRKAFTYQERRKERPAGRLYCHSEGIRMDDIKLIRKTFSTDKVNLTLNDVACAILARALRIAAERTEPKGVVKDKRVAVFVPISVRERGDWSLSNRTTGAVAWFHFGQPHEGDIDKQLMQVNREMRRIKQSHLPKLWLNVFDFYCRRRITYMPNYPGFRQFFYRAFSEYHVATNVPGPAKTVRFGDHEAYNYHVLPPSCSGKATMAIGMISYANDFSLAVSCDDVDEFRHLPQEICKAFQDSAVQVIEAAQQKLKQQQ